MQVNPSASEAQLHVRLQMKSRCKYTLSPPRLLPTHAFSRTHTHTCTGWPAIAIAINFQKHYTGGQACPVTREVRKLSSDSGGQELVQ